MDPLRPLLRPFLRAAPLVALVALVACASGPAPVANPPSVAVTSSSTPQSIPRRPAGPACDATNAYVVDGKAPPSWTRTGRVTLTVVGTNVTAEEVDDAAGKPVARDTQKAELTGSLASFPAPWICQVGAVARIDQASSSSEADLAKRGSGAVVFDVFAPPGDDEAADLATLCHEPPGVTADTNAVQRMAAMHFATQWLTSRRYRTLSHGVEVQIASAGDRAARRAAVTSAADRVDAAAKAAGTDSCAYARILRELATSP